jgi:hypothetical protein
MPRPSTHSLPLWIKSASPAKSRLSRSRVTAKSRLSRSRVAGYPGRRCSSNGLSRSQVDGSGGLSRSQVTALSRLSRSRVPENPGYPGRGSFIQASKLSKKPAKQPSKTPIFGLTQAIQVAGRFYKYLYLKIKNGFFNVLFFLFFILFFFYPSTCPPDSQTTSSTDHSSSSPEPA